MADEKKPEAAETKGSSTHRAWWQEVLLNIPKELYGFLSLGPFVLLIWGIYRDENGRRLTKEMIRSGKILWKWTNEEFNRLIGVINVALLFIVAISGLLLFGISTPSQYSFWGSVWPNTVLNRTYLGLPLMLLVVFWIVQMIFTFSRPLIAIGLAEKWLTKDRKDEVFAIRFVRMQFKFAGWYAFGFTVLNAVTWYHEPGALAIAVPGLLIYPLFCNAWRRGDSEHVRRTVLIGNAFLEMCCVIFASVPGSWHGLTSLAIGDKVIGPYVALILFFSLGLLAVSLGRIKTGEDKARIAKAQYDELKDVDLGRVAAIKSLLNDDSKSNRTAASPMGYSYSQPDTAWGRPVQPLSRTSEIFQAIIGILLLSAVFMGAVYMFNLYMTRKP